MAEAAGAQASGVIVKRLASLAHHPSVGERVDKASLRNRQRGARGEGQVQKLASGSSAMRREVMESETSAVLCVRVRTGRHLAIARVSRR